MNSDEGTQSDNQQQAGAVSSLRNRAGHPESAILGDRPAWVEALEGRTLLSTSIVPAGDLGAEEGAAAHFAAASAGPSVSASAGLTRADRFKLLTRLADPLQKSLRITLRNSGEAAFDASLLSYMLRRDGVNYFYRPKSLPGVSDWINNFLSGRANQQIVRADAILAHKFPEQFSSDEYTIQLPAGEIDWDRQPASTSNPGFLHALNRHGYWRELGMAWQVTGEGKYVRELVAQLQSWSKQAPTLSDPEDWREHPAQWSLLDAADRVRNWIETYYRVLGAPDWTPAANSLFLFRLFDHGDFLGGVANSSYKKNRTAVHAGALVRIGILFPEFKDAAAWEHRGFDMTFRCLAAQFYPDGGHVEQTPAYQAATANAMFEGFYLAQLNGRTNWTKGRRRRLTNAIESLYQLLNPNGDMPGLSDTYRSSNPRPFIFRAGFIFNDARYKRTSTPTIEDILLIGPKRIGVSVLNQATRLPNRGEAYAMPDSGYYILRTRQAQSGDGNFYSASQIIFDAGPKGGGHGHFDLLSFEYQQEAPYVPIPDPGPYIYDNSPERQYVISTPAHNTISIDGVNHRAVEGAGNPNVVVDEFWWDDDEARITAHHYAYDHLAGAPVVGRTLWIDRSVSEVVLAIDWGRASKLHTFTSSFNLVGTDVSLTEPGIVDVKFSNTQYLRVQSLAVPGQSEALLESFISAQPPPNAKSPSKRLAVSQTGTSGIFVTLFSNFVRSKNTGQVTVPPARVEFESPPEPGQPVAVRLTLHDGSIRSLTFNPPDLAPRAGA